jgi:hypothetical protein
MLLLEIIPKLLSIILLNLNWKLSSFFELRVKS